MRTITYNQEIKKFSSIKSKSFGPNWYIKNGYLSMDSVKTIKDLLSEISPKNLDSAWKIFASKWKLELMKFEVKQESVKYIISGKSKNLVTDNKLFGLMYSDCYQSTDRGVLQVSKDNDGTIYFYPTVSFGLVMRTVTKSGHSESTPIPYEKGQATFWYDIPNKKFLAYTEVIKGSLY